MNNYLLSLLVCFLGTTTLLGQPFPSEVQVLLDSLSTVEQPTQKAKIHSEIGFLLSELDSTNANLHTHKALQLAIKHQLPKEQAKAYKNLGMIEGHWHHIESAISYYDTAFQIYQSIQDTSGMIAVLNNSGRYHCYMGACETGIEKYHLAESWIDTSKSYKFLAVRTNYGICLMECRAYEDCLKICREAIPMAEQENYLFIAFRLRLLVANSLNFLKRHNEAQQEFDKALPLAEDLGNPYAVSAVLNDKAGSLVDMGYYEQAYTTFQLSLENSLQNEQGLQNDYRIYINLGEASKKLGKLEESIQWFEKGLAGTKETKDLVILADSYEMAAEVYHLAGKDATAYEYMVEAKTIRDTVFTNEMRQNLQEITTRYETEKIKKELAASQLQFEQEQSRHQLEMIGGLSLLVLCGIGYLFFIGRQRRLRLESEKRKIELEYGLLRAQMNPHFVFNSLNSIQGFFADNQFVQGNEFLGKFSRLIRRVLDQSVAPAILLSEELATLQLYLDVEKIRLRDKLSYEIWVHPTVETELLKVPPLILQPFVENAIWHGIAPKNSYGKVIIGVNMDDRDQFLEIFIEDDGVGLSNKNKLSKKAHESKGIQITRERLGKSGRVTIFDKKKKDSSGVKVCLKIPIIDHD
ncbi:MAG: histidine kinase [Bacteroidota bacterium]